MIARAIDRLAEAQDRLTRTEAALTRAEDLRFKANRALEEAESATADARRNAGRALADALLLGTEPSTAPIEALDEAVVAARQRQVAVRKAGEALRAQLETDQRSVGYARAAVLQAATAVLATSPAVEQAVVRLERAETELLVALKVVDQIAGANILFVRQPAPGGLDDNAALAQRARSALLWRETAPFTWNRQQLPATETPPAAVDWQAALAVLLADPDAAIPD